MSNFRGDDFLIGRRQACLRLGFIIELAVVRFGRPVLAAEHKFALALEAEEADALGAGEAG